MFFRRIRPSGRPAGGGPGQAASGSEPGRPPRGDFFTAPPRRFRRTAAGYFGTEPGPGCTRLTAAGGVRRIGVRDQRECERGITVSKLLRLRVTPARLDQWVGWSAAFLIQGACTTLVLKWLPALSLPRSYLLVSSIAAGWLALAVLFPRGVRA